MTNTSKEVWLMSGSWHRPNCWEPLQEELADAGINTQTFGFKENDAFSTFDDYAYDAAYELNADPSKEYILVGHSRAANVLPRLAPLVTTAAQVMLCPSLDNATLRPKLTKETVLPVKQSEAFNSAVLWDEIDPELCRIDPNKARDLLYQDCDPAIQNKLVAALITTRRARTEPSLRSWPDIPLHFMYGSRDRVVRPEWSAYVARDVLHIEPTVLDSDHSPMLSQTAHIASLLIHITTGKLTSSHTNN